jgi:purine-cytosine permease-like protein
MKEGARSETMRLLLWVMALMTLPIVLMGTFPLEPGGIDIDWSIYIILTQTILIVILLTEFIYKKVREQSSLRP